MEREGKKNRSIVKCYWVYQNNSQVLDGSIASAVLIPKEGQTRHLKGNCVISAHVHTFVFSDFSRQKEGHRQMDSNHRHRAVRILRANPLQNDFMCLTFPSAFEILTFGRCLG